MDNMLARLVAIAAFTLLTACASSSPESPTRGTDSAVAQCLALYEDLDRATTTSGVANPSSPLHVEGFPYLRVDRFLASYGEQARAPETEAAWLERLAALDREARELETALLPEIARTRLHRRHPLNRPLSESLTDCSRTLQSADLPNPARLALLRERAVVPPDYQTGKQIIGLYPITSIPVRRGVAGWHAETRTVFAQPVGELAVKGKLRRFQPPPGPSDPAGTTAIARDALGIPDPTPEQLDALFAAHAPVWEIDVAGDFDLPGAPFWLDGGIPSVDTEQAAVFRYHSFTRWQGEAVLQLNYGIWFIGRPLESNFDILGGALDGLSWRVTLDRDGRVLIYDTIHPCGCYHLFFPTSTLRPRPEALRRGEPPFVPQAAPALTQGQRIVIRVSSGEHYIQRVYGDMPSGATYSWRPYADLYGVPVVGGGGQRSLFGPDGLVAGTERAERWLLWPMGIASPGAMRERGRQATAFVGRRHFDDADLLDRNFGPAGS
jgi:hypothetical protein